MEREYHKWESGALGREMELLIFGHAGERVLVFPSRKQRFFEYEEQGMIHSLRHRIKAGKLQLVCVDGVDAESLYCFDIGPEARLERHLQYERYLLQEVLPFLGGLLDFGKRKKPPTLLTAHGCSFGAYHAMTLALRHPEHFARVVAFSGRYDLTLHAGNFHSLFQGYYSDALEEIMPSHFLPRMRALNRLKALRKLRVTLAIGEDDAFYEDNVGFAAALKAKRIPYEFHEWSGEAHRFRYWRQMVRLYL